MTDFTLPELFRSMSVQERKGLVRCNHSKSRVITSVNIIGNYDSQIDLKILNDNQKAVLANSPWTPETSWVTDCVAVVDMLLDTLDQSALDKGKGIAIFNDNQCLVFIKNANCKCTAGKYFSVNLHEVYAVLRSKWAEARERRMWSFLFAGMLISFASSGFLKVLKCDFAFL